MYRPLQRGNTLKRSDSNEEEDLDQRWRGKLRRERYKFIEGMLLITVPMASFQI